jgi:hypothetical protein
MRAVALFLCAGMLTLWFLLFYLVTKWGTNLGLIYPRK